nr:RNA-dependent RNA polymerase [Partitiviridae sp.]
MAFNSVRNYLHERNVRFKYESKWFTKLKESPTLMTEHFRTKRFLMVFRGSRHRITEKERKQMLQSEYDKIQCCLQLQNELRSEPFEYYMRINLSQLDQEFMPNSGIEQVLLKYHKGRVIETSATVTEAGFPPHPLTTYLVRSKYPQYYHLLTTYCRPLGTTKATFNDFNKMQRPIQPIATSRSDQVIKLITKSLNAKPYLPLHFVDCQYTGMPLSTGTGYHNRHSFKINAHARYSRPDAYKTKPTSKGYYYNAFLESARTIVHRIKKDGFPFDFKLSDTYSDTEVHRFLNQLTEFLAKYPTIMFTRCHISKLFDTLKQRPVYAVDELFLYIECMLMFPLFVQARHEDCSIMYGYETIRGGNRRIDQIAQLYASYFNLDWSSFDQSVPHFITDLFFTKYLPSLIIVNYGYQPTYEYPSHPTMSYERMAKQISNLLDFLHYWFNNMTFITANGYAYQRKYAGIPSGMLATQYLDSFCNLYIIYDAFFEFNLSDDEIESCKFIVMGDDNCGFLPWNIIKAFEIVDFINNYAKERYNMTLNMNKSRVTDNRQKIETLAYQCNFGNPKRSIDKLFAQLCYPERGYRDKFMSMRAVGIAYASCGQDLTFYNFCKDVFYTFLPYATPLTPDERTKFTRQLPGPFKLIDEPPEFLFELKFPDYQDIINMISRWHGPLTPEPKWNRSHFINAPDESLPLIETLAQARDRFLIKSGLLPTLPQRV